MYVELEEIVKTAVLPDKSPCRCEIQPFDFAVRLRPETALRPELQLVVIVGNRNNIFEPLDKLQAQCIAEMQARLLHLGARSGVWQKKNKSSAV